MSSKKLVENALVDTGLPNARERMPKYRPAASCSALNRPGQGRRVEPQDDVVNQASRPYPRRDEGTRRAVFEAPVAHRREIGDASDRRVFQLQRRARQVRE